MKMFQYIILHKDANKREIWVCNKCKKENNGLILEGKWKLIGKSDDAKPCGLCDLELVDGDARAV